MAGFRTSNAGFTLVEVVVALALVAGAALALAQLGTLSIVSIRTARIVTLATAAAAEQLEQLEALAWWRDGSGADDSDLTSDLSVEPPSSGGAGLQASPADSLARNAAGYVDFLDAAGRWIGTGSVPPAGAAYVRRWKVTAAAPGTDGRLLQVVVATVGAAARAAEPGASNGTAVYLETVKVRKSR